MLCHGMLDTKMGVFWPDFAEALAGHHVSSLRFDFSGNGESEGEFKYGNILLEARPHCASGPTGLPACYVLSCLQCIWGLQ